MDDNKIEKLEIRVAELIKERDEYDSRRREAVGKIEEWRRKYWKLERNLKALPKEIECDGCGDTCTVDISRINDASWYDSEGANYYDALRGSSWWSNGEHGLSGGRKLDWVICGAETGHGKRPMNLDWARSIRDQCQETGIPFFFKKDSECNHKLDGNIYEEFPV